MRLPLTMTECVAWMAEHDGECIWTHGGTSVHVTACREWDGLRVGSSTHITDGCASMTDDMSVLLFVRAVRQIAAEHNAKRPA